jgi:hypothetical protein
VAARKRRSLLVLLITLVAVAIATGRLYAEGDAVRLVFVLAPLFLLGSVLSGGMPAAHRRKGRHPVVSPVLTGLLLFLAFLVMGAVVRLVPAFDHAVEDVLAKADESSRLAVAVSAVVAGVAEEVFYRGALFERLRLPIVTTTLAHALAVLPSGNVAMVGAALVLGGVCGLSRRASGGWWTAAVVHSTWSLLVLAWLPR